MGLRQPRIKFSDGGWIDLRRDDGTPSVRRVYASEDISLSPAQQTNVDVRIMQEGIRSKPFVGLVEAEAVPNLRHVYSARSLIPAKFSGIKVPVLNAEKESRILTKGTELGKLHTVQVMDEVPTEAPTSVLPEDVSNKEEEAIDKLMTKLPEDMTNEQRKRVRALLFRDRSNISTGEHDIGQTNLVEHQIDTGEQLLRQ